MPKRPLFPRKQVTVFAIVFLFCSLLTVFNSCRKLDIDAPDDPKLVEAFFKLPANAGNEEKLLVSTLKNQFATNNGASNFLSWHGQPLWANAVKATQDSRNFTLIIPTKKEGNDFIQTFFFARCINGRFHYEMHRQSSLINKLPEPSTRGVKPEGADLLFAYFNKAVLG